MSSEAQETNNYYDLLAWALVHKQKIIQGTVVLLAVGAVIAFLRWRSNQAATEADKALFKLHAAPARGETSPDPKAEGYLRVATDYSGTRAGERAYFLAAGALFKEGKYADAGKQFESFRSTYPQSTLMADAVFGSAAALEAQGKTTEAAAAYQDLISKYPTAGVSTQAKLALAAIHEAAAKPDQALKLYDELVRPDAQTAWAAEVGTRRARLLAKNPALNTNLQQRVTITRVSSTSSNSPIQLQVGTNSSAAPSKK